MLLAERSSEGGLDRLGIPNYVDKKSINLTEYVVEFMRHQRDQKEITYAGGVENCLLLAMSIF